MIRFLFFIVVLTQSFFNIGSVKAQAPIQKNGAQILIDLQRFNTLGTVLYVAAHPDDENTRLLSWLVNEKKYRTAYLSLTRGDGGQNLIGTELGTLLGAIRTQELLAARKLDGAEQYFTRAYDFGFSKNPEETLHKWNEDSLLQDLVTLIRTIKPDVMICRFPPTGEGGHGHHTASAILGRKAFELAADSHYQVAKNLPAWKVKRLFWNTFNFGSANTISENQLKLEVGNFNPILGKSYGEIASESRSQHKSQGFGTAATRGDSKEYFMQWNGDSVKTNLFEHLNTSWSRIPRTQEIQRLVQTAITNYAVQKPYKIIPTLLMIRDKILKLQMSREFNPEKDTWLNYKLEQLNQLIEQCSGLWATATINTDEISRGDSVTIKVDGIYRSNIPILFKKIKLGNQEYTIDTTLSNNQLWTWNATLIIPESTPYTAPYWLEKPIKDNLFQPLEDKNGNQPYIYHHQLVELTYEINGQLFKKELPLNYRYVDPVKGELYQSVAILPALTMQWSASSSIHPNGAEREVTLKVSAHTDVDSSKLVLQFPAIWKVSSVKGWNIPPLKKGQSYDIILKIAYSGNQITKDTLHASIEASGKIYRQELTKIEYEHIPRQTILKSSELALTSFPIDLKFKKIGYIEGAGDMVASSLKQLGYEIVNIQEDNYSKITWKDLDAVVVGIRAYNTHKWLNDAYPSLMEYVKNGGNLVVQYNTNNRLGPIIAKMFPYEMQVTTGRVTVEEAPITILDSATSILNYPNKINTNDFDGWVQERGIYFAGDRAAEWKSVFAMNDPGESPKDGSLVHAAYGKGNLVYTGLVFFRELPAGVVGAYRLFVNLIEMPKNE